MEELFLRLLLLLRFLCFVAVVYIALHLVFVRLISRPDSKILWFFSVVTGPLTRPVAACVGDPASMPKLLAISLGVYAVLWLLVRAITEIAARAVT